MLTRPSLIDAALSLLIAAGFTAASYLAALALGVSLELTPLLVVEIAGVWLNFACVWSTARQNPWAWIYGVCGVLLLGYLFWQLALYSSMVMSLAYYLPIQFVGLYQWLRGGAQRQGVTVSRMSAQEWLATAIIVPLAIGLWAKLLSTFTDAAYVYLDACVFGCSIAAQYLLTNKRIESWLIWLVVNVMSVALYWATGAYVLALQYLLFFFHPVYGLWLWSSDYRQSRQQYA